MRKRTWLVALFLVGVLVVTLGATSIFAQGPAVSDGEAWEEMHQACENGDKYSVLSSCASTDIIAMTGVTRTLIS